MGFNATACGNSFDRTGAKFTNVFEHGCSWVWAFASGNRTTSFTSRAKQALLVGFFRRFLDGNTGRVFTHLVCHNVKRLTSALHGDGIKRTNDCRLASGFAPSVFVAQTLFAVFSIVVAELSQARRYTTSSGGSSRTNLQTTTRGNSAELSDGNARVAVEAHSLIEADSDERWIRVRDDLQVRQALLQNLADAGHGAARADAALRAAGIAPGDARLYTSPLDDGPGSPEGPGDDPAGGSGR